MKPSDALFTAQIEYHIGDKLSQDFFSVWPAYHRWFQLSEHPISGAEGRGQIAKYMPELLATYDSLCVSLQADEHVAAFLSLYNPPSFPTGCSQMAWQKDDLSLVRNYDFPSGLSEKKLLSTNWNGTKVMAMTDCIWGVLDGINEHGLAVSLAYGGRAKRGQGFAITLVLRYVLEFCQTVTQAVKVIAGIPVHMPYNVTLIDRSGTVKTIEICPEHPPRVTKQPCATNHQHEGEVENLDAVADSRLREGYVATRLADPTMTTPAAINMFLQPPLYRKAKDWCGWGTLYTAYYNIAKGEVTLLWPNGQSLQQSFQHFIETSVVVDIPAFR